MEELNLESITYNSKKLKGLEDKDNPLRKIHRQCDLLKQFLNAHSGFDRENLQDYLKLCPFINNSHKNKLRKANENTVKYRDLFKVSSKG